MWQAWVYLTVSCVSLTVQTLALLRIIARRATRPGSVRNGLLRTSVCRVTVSVGYVGLGIAALNKIQNTAAAAFTVLIAVQVLWQLNALLDARLAARLSPAKHVKGTHH